MVSYQVILQLIGATPPARTSPWLVTLMTLIGRNIVAVSKSPKPKWVEINVEHHAFQRYDPKQVNDRLLLGMKGTFSELELSILRQRSQEALRFKAARGDLHRTVAVGYVRRSDDGIEMDPDEQVRNAIHLIFRKFVKFGSARQVVLW